MDTPGTLLRSEREKQKKSLKDIEKALKIKIEYLRAIENDNYEILPADLFTRSYLRSYSGTLGLEGDHILDLYNKQFGAPIEKEQEHPKKQPGTISLFKSNHIYILAVCIGLITVSMIVYKRYVTEKPVAAVPARVTADIAGTDNNARRSEPARILPAKELTLKIEADELTWLEIKIDSSEPKEMLLRKGETLNLTALEKFVLKVGNAGGTRLVFNGSDIGTLGPHGQVIDIVLP